MTDILTILGWLLLVFALGSIHIGLGLATIAIGMLLVARGISQEAQ